MHRHLSRVILIAALVGLPASGWAQEAQPLTQADLLGVWEGLDSDGAELYWNIAAADSDAVELAATVTRDGARAERQATYEVRSIGADVAQLVGTGSTEPALARRLVPDTLRVTWPSGREALLVRVAEAVPDRALMFAASAGFTDQVQAGLLRFDGHWNDPAGGTLELSVTDTARGLVTWTLGGELEQLTLTMARDDGWVFQRPDGSLVTLALVDGALTMRMGEGEPTRLQRIR